MKIMEYKSQLVTGLVCSVLAVFACLVGINARWISLLLFCLAVLVVRSEIAALRKLRTELHGNKVATLEGRLTSRSDFPYSHSPAARTFFYFDINGVSFAVDQKAYLAFQNLRPACDFRVYYVPCRRWLANLEPIPEA